MRGPCCARRRRAARPPATEFDPPGRPCGRGDPAPSPTPSNGVHGFPPRRERQSSNCAMTEASADKSARTDHTGDAEPARHPVPDARRPAEARAGLGQGVERRGHLQEAARGALRPPPLRAARRTALRQRHPARRPCGEQDPQGHDRQGAPARRLRCALHPGLGLPRPADREPDREDPRPRPGRAPRSRRRAAPTRPSRSRSRWPTSSASACSATGSIRT